MERVFDLFPRLKERERQKAGTMSGGEQQMLAIGRALMANPKLLLLDEPSMGIAPVLVERIYETIAEINRQGTTILLVEQNANFALEVSKRGYVLETGTVALADESEHAARQPRGPEGVPGRMTVYSPSLGAKALWLLYVWLASAIVASYLSERKGYGEKVGLASGLLLSRGRGGDLAAGARPGRLALEAAGAVRQRRQDGGRGAGGARRRGRRAAEMLDWSLYSPLLLALLVYVVLFIAASIIRARGNDDRAERILDIGFLVALIAGAWTLVLLVFAILDEPDDIWDMVIIVVIIGVFFAVLLSLLFGLFEWIFTRGSRRRREAPEQPPGPETS